MKHTNLATSRARTLRKNLTEAEKVLGFHLRNLQLGGYRFRRQRPIGNYVLDFVCLDRRLVIELGSGQHLKTKSYDATRTSDLSGLGYSVIRF